MAEETAITRNCWWPGAAFAALVFILALSVRGYRISEIQPHHDESPAFGFSRGEPLEWAGSPAGFLSALFQNAAMITEGDSPPMICVVGELFRFCFGENLAAARWFHALIQSAGVALTAWLAWRIFRPVWAPIFAVGVLAIFSIPSIVFGQFGEVYAIYFTAGVIQYLFYWTVLRVRYRWRDYLVFAGIAYCCALFGYLQVLITAGLLLASVCERGGISRGGRLLRASLSFLFYGVLNAMPFFYFITRTTFAGVFRHYYSAYYPPLGLLASEGESLVGWGVYFLTRTYDLFNYHLSLVFDPRFYQPLEWNWFSLPFLLAAAGAAILYFPGRRGRSRGIISALICLLIVFLAANLLRLVPYGGLRNTLFIAPAIWLSYGVIVEQYQKVINRRWLRVPVVMILIVLPLLPFLFSLPGFYSDRVSAVDLARLEELIEEYRPDTLIMAEATYDPFRMILQRHPEFQSRVLERNGVNLTSFFEFSDSRWGRYPLPVPGKNVLALDFYLSYNSRCEGPGITNDHPDLTALAGPGWIIEPLIEQPGKNCTVRQHQSIYYPPNSFYVYRLRPVGTPD